MKKTIMIDGVGRLFRTSGLTPRIYRGVCGRDVFQDIAQLEAEVGSGGLSMDALRIFENLSYTMAKQGNDALPADAEGKYKPFPATPDEWLDTLEVFDIWDIFPQLAELWREGNQTIVESKKKTEAEATEG